MTYEPVSYTHLDVYKRQAHGAIVSGGGARATRAQLEAVLPRFIGDIAQIPPMYSALKRDGQKLCDLARQGIDVKVEPRPTQVYACRLYTSHGTQTDRAVLRLS